MVTSVEFKSPCSLRVFSKDFAIDLRLYEEVLKIEMIVGRMALGIVKI